MKLESRMEMVDLLKRSMCSLVTLTHCVKYEIEERLEGGTYGRKGQDMERCNYRVTLRGEDCGDGWEEALRD